jgi:hypothetical protein
MTRVNRADTLLTELRDIKRRLRLLEAAVMRPPGTTAAAVAAGPSPAPGPATSEPEPPTDHTTGPAGGHPMGPAGVAEADSDAGPGQAGQSRHA